MKAVDYLKTMKRMCNFYTYCSKCPLGEVENSDELDCWEYGSDYPEKAVEIVEKWAKENPTKTYLSVLLGKFPNVKLSEDKHPNFCPDAIFDITTELEECCEMECIDCWNREIKERED